MIKNSLAIATIFIVLLVSANFAWSFQTDVNPDIEMTFQGIVKCSTSQKPIKYVNIGIMGKGIGTVSGPDGRYSLELDPLYNMDTLMFSCIGYQPIKITVGDFRKLEPGHLYFSAGLRARTHYRKTSQAKWESTPVGIGVSVDVLEEKKISNKLLNPYDDTSMINF